MTGTALISVIIPVYNTEKYLEMCIESVLSQTYKNIEIILIDDGSNDKSPEICDKYADEYTNIKVCHKKNEGVSVARNTGIEMASGEYLMFLDSDDLYEPDAVRRLYSAIGTAQLAVGDYNNYYMSADRKERIKSPFGSGTAEISINEYLDKMAVHTIECYFGSNWNKLYLKKIIDENNIRFNVGESYAEDFMFNVDYLKYISRVSVTDAVINNYRVETESSISKSVRETMAYWERSKRVCEGFYELYRVHGIYEKYETELSRMWLMHGVGCLRNWIHEGNKSISEKKSIFRLILSECGGNYPCRNTLEKLTIGLRVFPGLVYGLYRLVELRLDIKKRRAKVNGA